MPYSLVKDFGDCSGWAVVKDKDGKQMGCHKTKQKAQAQLTALNLSESEKGASAAEGYATRDEARERSREIGCSGAHQMEDGLTWMPCSSHASYERVTEGRSGNGYKDGQFGPSGRIFLQDLNVALSSNFREMQKNRPMVNFVENVETYRQWIINLLKHEQVILVTARSVKYEELTLNRINDQTGWQPNNWHFNPWKDPSGKGALRAHRAKERYLNEFIFPKYGDDTSKYFAIESNKYTRSMYRSYDIECRDANRDDSQPWKSLLP